MELLLLALVLLVGLCTYGVPVLFNPDEGRYAEIAREMLTGHQYFVPYLNGVIYFEKPPFIYWLTTLSLKLFGYSTWSVRLPNILLATLGVYSTYFLCYKIFNRKIALFASLFLASSIIYVAMTRLLTLDLGISFFINISLLLFLLSQHRDFEKTKTLLLMLAYLASGLAILTKGLIGFVIPVLVIGLWIALLGQWRIIKSMRIGYGILIILLCNLPWLLIVQHHFPDFLNRYIINQQFLRYATPIAQREMNHFVYCALVLMCVFPWTVFLPQSIYHFFRHKWRERKHYSAEVFCLCWAAVIIAFFAGSHSVLPSYFTLFCLPLCILIAIYFSENFKNLYNKTNSIAMIIFGLFCLSVVGAFVVAAINPARFELSFSPYSTLHVITVIVFFLLALAAIIFYFLRRPKLMLAAMILSTGVLINIGFIIMDNYRKAEEFALLPRVQTLLTHYPNATVASYHVYIQSSPYYLQRKIMLVGWQGELDYGYQQQPASHQWMLNDDEFWPLWSSHRPIFIIMRTTDYQTIFASKQHRGVLLAQTPYYNLVANGDYQ